MQEVFLEMRKNLRVYFQEISLRKVRENLKTFKGLATQTLFSMEMTASIYSGIQKLKECKVGHLIVTESADISSTAGVLSKRDILVYMIKNFTTDSQIDMLLDEQICHLQIGTLGAVVFSVSKHETLRRVFSEMLRLKLACVPVVDEQRKYYGVINKHHVELLFRECCLHFVSAGLSSWTCACRTSWKT